MNRYIQNTLNLCEKAHNNNSYDDSSLRSLIKYILIEISGEYKIYLINYLTVNTIFNLY